MVEFLFISYRFANRAFFFSFIGCGIIKVAPRIVWESVRNPLSRFSYDSLLKVLFHFILRRHGFTFSDISDLIVACIDFR